nr:MAG TPA: Selenoprotein S (SelS) [Caudoviricetes sp.]
MWVQKLCILSMFNPPMAAGCVWRPSKRLRASRR